jgi:hypothetical protein
VGKMDLNDAMALPEAESADEKLIWVLDQMIRSSNMREQYFIRINSFNSKFIENEISLDPKLGIVSKNKDMYGAIHVDYIFRVMGAIESFQGALAAAWRLSTKKSSDLEKVLKILINPVGPKGGIVTSSRKSSLSEQKKCRYSSIPLIGKEDKLTASKLRIYLKETFDRIESGMFYSQRFWDEYRVVRDVYSHNYRFVFHDHVIPGRKAMYDESIIGVIQNPNDLVGDMAFIGFFQRIAMRKLVSILSKLERWIYANMMLTVVNNCQPVLPKYIPFLDKKRHQEYDRIRETKNCKLTIPRLAIKGKFAVDSQWELIIDFLVELNKWGEPLRVRYTNGREGTLQVNQLKQEQDRIRTIRRHMKESA